MIADIICYIAACGVISASKMRTMWKVKLALTLAAIGFVAYGVMLGLTPIIIFNVVAGLLAGQEFIKEFRKRQMDVSS